MRLFAAFRHNVSTCKKKKEKEIRERLRGAVKVGSGGVVYGKQAMQHIASAIDLRSYTHYMIEASFVKLKKQALKYLHALKREQLMLSDILGRRKVRRY